jgi:phosphatidylglycerol:prolipoprotein diacylglycerol transferase
VPPLSHALALIPITPNPILFSIGPINIGWYGIGYVIALGVLLFVAQAELARRGYNPNHIWNALLLVGALALIGGRLYHVIDQWGPLYSQDPLKAILPPYAGLGLYGGVAGAVLGILIYTGWKKIPLPLGLDVVAAGALFAQGIARWGNFFNQELYGPPTNLPWGIAIDCAHRVAPWFCPPQGVYDINTGFQPLFFYESALDILGGFVILWISRRYLYRLQPGDLAASWGIWYGLTRAGLETLRTDWDWKIGGVPTAIIIGVGVALFGVFWILYNHPRGKEPYHYLVPWTPDLEPKLDRTAFVAAAAGGGTLAMAGGAVPNSEEDADYDSENDDEEWEDTDTDNDAADDSSNEGSEDF